eukprot:TRINITY_DN4600_c0_g1_i2.p1 TRINITY_DN4600_c0_g1~~TRINITY_DN4600_c0_g1_i2.p1  ORF type:complete len:787 (-),score=140.14 TRINITY_DN4600_c0_g1_i2:637-2997(-)
MEDVPASQSRRRSHDVHPKAFRAVPQGLLYMPLPGEGAIPRVSETEKVPITTMSLKSIDIVPNTPNVSPRHEMDLVLSARKMATKRHTSPELDRAPPPTPTISRPLSPPAPLPPVTPRTATQTMDDLRASLTSSRATVTHKPRPPAPAPLSASLPLGRMASAEPGQGKSSKEAKSKPKKPSVPPSCTPRSVTLVIPSPRMNASTLDISAASDYVEPTAGQELSGSVTRSPSPRGTPPLLYHATRPTTSHQHSEDPRSVLSWGAQPAVANEAIADDVSGATPAVADADAVTVPSATSVLSSGSMTSSDFGVPIAADVFPPPSSDGSLFSAATSELSSANVSLPSAHHDVIGSLSAAGDSDSLPHEDSAVAQPSPLAQHTALQDVSSSTQTAEDVKRAAEQAAAANDWDQYQSYRQLYAQMATNADPPSQYTEPEVAYIRKAIFQRPATEGSAVQRRRAREHADEPTTQQLTRRMEAIRDRLAGIQTEIPPLHRERVVTMEESEREVDRELAARLPPPSREELMTAGTVNLMHAPPKGALTSRSAYAFWQHEAETSERARKMLMLRTRFPNLKEPAARFPVHSGYINDITGAEPATSVPKLQTWNGLSSTRAPMALKGFTPERFPQCFTVSLPPPPGYSWLFVYDGLMNPHRLVATISRHPAGRAWGVLYGYSLVFNRPGASGARANIMPWVGQSVEGAVYLVPTTCMYLVDAECGAPKTCTRQSVKVWTCYEERHHDIPMPHAGSIAKHCVEAFVYISDPQVCLGTCHIFMCCGFFFFVVSLTAFGM